MKRVVVFGPVGTGRTTLATRIADEQQVANHDDLLDATAVRHFLLVGGVGVLHARELENARTRFAELAEGADIGDVEFVPAPLAQPTAEYIAMRQKMAVAEGRGF
jgi:hypothetical protein